MSLLISLSSTRCLPLSHPRNETYVYIPFCRTFAIICFYFSPFENHHHLVLNFRRMPEPELKSLCNDLLTTIPADVQMNLSAATSQLDDFFNDTADFPHKCIPLKSFPTAIKDIFHRIASHNASNNNGGYSYEALIAMDLVINPRRFSSWHAMMNIKIGQLNALFTNTYDLTK